MVRHLGGFLVAGIIAFTTDAAVLAALMYGAGLGPLLSRVGSILVATGVAWQAHRRLTFRVTSAPTLAEFVAYVAVAWSAAALNYGLYALILLMRPETSPMTALFLASLVAMFASYAGMRLGVFGRPRHD